MKITLKEAADFIGGKIIGDPNCEVLNVSKIHEAQKGDLTFLYLPAYTKYLATTKASAVIVKPGTERPHENISLIESSNPDVAFQSIVRKYFSPEFPLVGIDTSAQVDKSVVIGDSTALGKNVVIEEGCEIGNNTKIFHNTVIMKNSKIGSDTLIFPNVTVREGCIIGSNVIIHSGTVIGSDGFGYSPRKTGGYDKVPQIGNVIIEDEVEIGSNVSIDRAAIGSTIIKKGAKLDNLIQIAHNVVVGENTAISAQTGISGSSTVGKNCIFGGQVGITGHIEIADGTMIGAQSGITKTLTKGKYFGTPAKEMGQSLRLEGHIRSLPDYARKIKELEKKLNKVEENLKNNAEVKK
ncbi:MAG: UDP-3-O-(3-hydroxymyristoyl)glucosamine N-acyltransferase [Bacteroidetes bacterium]|nr:UDP-3-O-(3-hydroxymyristoyl)glucosamine N-acyltransferase [Bacteroidota bacterium]MBU1680006.1 UDP-3-O-(3-hydroxymyristoyl)glucosamine N-acyltransferase [Bacteroidota bacterium]